MSARIVAEVSRFATLNALEMKQSEMKWSTSLLIFLHIAVIFTCRVGCGKIVSHVQHQQKKKKKVVFLSHPIIFLL